MSVAERSTTIQSHRIAIGGIVPIVHGLATRIGLSGFVHNGPGGVTIEVQGPPTDLDDFAAALLAERPPLAHIAELSISAQAVGGDDEFIWAPARPRTPVAH